MQNVQPIKNFFGKLLTNVVLRKISNILMQSPFAMGTMLTLSMLIIRLCRETIFQDFLKILDTLTHH